MNRIDWMEVSREEWEGKQSELEAICRRCDWQTPPCTLPLAPGEALKGMIKNLRIPKVSHVCYSHEMAPYGLIGARGHYKNAIVEAFGLDMGDQVIMLCAFVTEKGVTP